MSEGTEELRQHLLFHKAMINDSVSTEKIDRYLSLLDEREHEKMQDETDESIRTVFRLVLEGSFDPWAIDLREFVKMYAKKVKVSKFDIIVAGKLMLMAWKVLKLQSNETKLESDRNMMEECDFGFDIDMDYFAEDPEKLEVPIVDLTGRFVRNPVRSVTMMEILDAFDEAQEEIRIAEEREITRQKLKAQEAKFDNKAHKEIDDSDVQRVWERIQKIGTGAFSIRELYTDDLENNIAVFWSALQLVRDGKLSMWQDELPYGDIKIDIKVDWVSGKLEEAEEGVLVPPQAVM